jgi:hypothetical protein
MAGAMSTPVVLAVPISAGAEIRTLRCAALWSLLAAKMLGGWGVQWDIRWHLDIGRDSFWIPPHVMTYAGVTLATLVPLAILLLETWRNRRGEPSAERLRVWGLVGTTGFHLAWWGSVLTVLAAPIDDLWHRLFGLDVTLWSPPHLMGMAGAQINTLGCLLIAGELWPSARAVRRVALVIGGTFLLGAFYITVDEAIQTAFRRGGVFFFTWAVLAAPALAFSFVLTARLARLRTAPLLMALGALAFHWLGTGVADLGFALVQPTPAIAEAIAENPDSPVAIAHEMARRNGTAPGRGIAMRVLPILPALLVVAADPRRRWVAASLTLGAALVGASGWLFARIPALSHALPSAVEAAVALVAASLTALAGGWAAARLARATAPA